VVRHALALVYLLLNPSEVDVFPELEDVPWRPKLQPMLRRDNLMRKILDFPAARAAHPLLQNPKLRSLIERNVNLKPAKYEYGIPGGGLRRIVKHKPTPEVDEFAPSGRNDGEELDDDRGRLNLNTVTYASLPVGVLFRWVLSQISHAQELCEPSCTNNLGAAVVHPTPSSIDAVGDVIQVNTPVLGTQRRVAGQGEQREHLPPLLPYSPCLYSCASSPQISSQPTAAGIPRSPPHSSSAAASVVAQSPSSQQNDYSGPDSPSPLRRGVHGAQSTPALQYSTDACGAESRLPPVNAPASGPIRRSGTSRRTLF